MSKDVLNKTIETGADIAGNMIASSVAGSVLPAAPLLGIIIGPIVSTVVGDVTQRLLSKSENTRLEFVRKTIEDRVQKRLDNGEQPRRDDNFYVRDEYYQSSASKLLEEALLKSKQEFEAKKLEYYGNFWANICFDNGVSYETANTLISQFSTLSYQQVRILVYLNSRNIIKLGNWEKYMFAKEVLSPYFTLYSDCLHLYNIRLAAQPKSVNGVQLGTPDICISPSGQLMCRLLELKLAEHEFQEISDLIAHINGIVSRLMKEANDDGSDRIISQIPESEIDKLFEG